MKEFSKLARREAGGITVKTLILSAMAAGAIVYGVAAIQDHNLVVELGKTVQSMAGDLSTIGKIRGYFTAEEGRVEKYHAKNAELFSSAAELEPFLAALPSSPTLAALKESEVQQYSTAKVSIAKERAASESVWKALTTPEDSSLLKAGLTPGNLALYSSIKDCALRGAGEGAYCGPSAAVGVRAQTSIAQAKELQAQSEAFARQSLATGWDDWDGAKAGLTQQAFAEIDQAKAQAKVSFDKGDIDKDDWNSLNAGFDASRVAAADHIAQDGQQLQQRVHTGHLSGFDWYLLSRWSQTSSSVSQVHVISHPYLVGASSYVEPSSVLARSSVSSSPVGAPVQSFVQAQAPQVAATAANTRLAGMEGANAAARAAIPSRQSLSATPSAANSAYGSRGDAIAAPVRMGPPAGANPYSVNSTSTPFGSKVSASFATGAGPRMASAMGSGYSAKGGIAAKVSSFSSARSASVHSSSGGGHAEGVGHAGVGHAAGGVGHGGGSAGG